MIFQFWSRFQSCSVESVTTGRDWPLAPFQQITPAAMDGYFGVKYNTTTGPRKCIKESHLIMFFVFRGAWSSCAKPILK